MTMTATTQTRTFNPGPLALQLDRAWVKFRRRRAINRAIAETRRQLGALTDRELLDLGLLRADIDRVAREAVLGK
jgi:uncharacterized protein YjiS (DUF1127 family)